MAKSEVYSWRVEPGTKQELEDAARRRDTSVAGLLDRIVGDWLDAERAEDRDAQELIRCQARKYVGAIKGADRHLAERVSEIVGESVAAAHERTRHRPR